MFRVRNTAHADVWCAVAPHEEGEAVLLDVGGMKCGGCSAAVKRILSARPEVLFRFCSRCIASL